METRKKEKFYIVFSHNQKIQDPICDTLERALYIADKRAQTSAGIYYVAEVLGGFESVATATKKEFFDYSQQ